MSTIDSARAALGMTDARLVSRLVAILDAFGVTRSLDDRDGRWLPAEPGKVKPGDVVIAYAHQRFRPVLVWNVTPSKLSGVYVSPSSPKFPNNITTKIADCLFVTAGEPIEQSDDEVVEQVVEAPAAAIATQPVEAQVTDDDYAAGMLPLAGGDGFLF